MDRYDPSRDVTEQFISKVVNWIGEAGEVLIVLRYLRAAGAKDYALCRSEHEFRRIIELVRVGTDIVVFRRKQLPIRGICTEALIKRACEEIPEGSEYLVLRTNRKSPDDPRLWGDMGDTHVDLRETLEEDDVFKSDVAIGPLPPFNDNDNPEMISASKGGIDGPR